MQTEKVILEKLRAICSALAESSEKVTFGRHPTFRVRNRTFAVYENQPAVHGSRIISIKTTLEHQSALVARGGFKRCMFGGRHGWTYIRPSPSGSSYRDFRSSSHLA